MGIDDDTDCDHHWEVVGAVFGSADSQVENRCTRCGGVAVDTTVTLNPGLDVPRFTAE